MNKSHKKFFLIAGSAFFLILLAGFQISFLNPSWLKLNLFLISAMYLALTKNNSKALFFAWLGGILTGASSFSIFGISGAVFLIFTAVFIVLCETVFLNLKTGTILFASAIGVTLYHFTNWATINIFAFFKIGVFENFGFYFANLGFLSELIFTALLMLAIFKIKNKI